MSHRVVVGDYDFNFFKVKIAVANYDFNFFKVKIIVDDYGFKYYFGYYFQNSIILIFFLNILF